VHPNGTNSIHVAVSGLSFGNTLLGTGWATSVLLCTRSKKISLKKRKGFRNSLSYNTPQKSEEIRGNAITQPRSHPIKKMGWDGTEAG